MTRLLSTMVGWGALLLLGAAGCSLKVQPADPVTGGTAGDAGSGGGGAGSGGTAGQPVGTGGAGATTGNDYCDPNPCEHGTCSIDGRAFSCACASGYDGVRCDRDIDECATAPCEHGTCLDRIGTYACDCGSTGYTGDRCETLIADCASTPCANGGACTDGDVSRSCDCTGTGATGVSCEIDIDECAKSPCVNGSCVNGRNSYFCDCTDTGYTGDDCGTGAETCADDPCDPLTTCTDAAEGPSCSSCPPGYAGEGRTGCEDIDECQTENGGCGPGECTNVPGGRMCGACPAGYLDSNDSCVDIDECQTENPCLNGGACQNTPGGFVCGCASGWTGLICDTGTIRLDAHARGYYSNRAAYPPNGATFAGFCASCSGASFRAFFVFSIPNFTGRVSSVTLTTAHVFYDSPDMQEDFGIYEVTGNATTLANLRGDAAVLFTDLGDGNLYASFSLTSGTVNTQRLVTLSGAGAKIQSSRGSDMAIGISPTTYSGQTSRDEWAKLSLEGENRKAELQIRIVP
jgi:hypothetical protein